MDEPPASSPAADETRDLAEAPVPVVDAAPSCDFVAPSDLRPVASMTLVEDALARAARPEKVIATLLWACEGRFDAAVFFLLDGQQAQARARVGFGPKGPVSFDDGFSLSLGEPSLIGAAARGDRPVCGPPREDAADVALAVRMGTVVSPLAAAVPFLVKGSVLGVLWGSSGLAPVRSALADELERVAAMGTLAFSRMPRSLTGRF